MKYEDKKTLAVSILMIVILGFFSYRNFTNIGSPEEGSPLTEISNIEFPSIEEMRADIERKLLDSEMEVSEIKYTNHNLTDKITFQYPSHWTKSSIGGIGKRENIINHLFMAYSPDITPTIVAGSRLISQPDPGSAIKTIKDIFQQEGITMNIFNETANDNKVRFEAEYLYPDGNRLISKKKIVLVGDHAYLIAVISPENRSDEMARQASHIIDSIQIMD